MRKMLKAILTLAGASALLMPMAAYADIELATVPETRDVTRAARLRSAQDPNSIDADTIWIGHIWDQTYTAGGKMVAGGYGPYRVGRGPNFPVKGVGGTMGDNGTWDFDRFQGPFSPGGAEDDSLQGWWPVARAYQSGAATVDYRRAFQAFDYGNQVNYVINQGAPKRTFGVTGLWHRDRGNTAYVASDTFATVFPFATNVQPVVWSPEDLGGTGSTASAWMGLRSHGDLSHVDLVANGGTGNPFNSQLMQYQGNNGFNQVGSVHVNGTDHNFPGYGSQMDQMLYRDITLANDADGLNIAFNFSTNMSLGKNTSTNVRVGWFTFDPLSNAQVGTGVTATPTSDGNFISSDVAAGNAPCDSFMVYIGAPVDDENVTYTAVTAMTTVYDKKRRWFSEVLQLNGTCLPSPGTPVCRIKGKQLASYAGVNPVTAVSVDVAGMYQTELQEILDVDGDGNGGTVRLVFRVKTNRGFDDENNGNPAATFNSGTRGAAIVDNVVVNALGAAWGDFEAADAINNDTAVDATNAWKSTGKPPAVFFHAHSVMPGDGLVYNDPCGDLDNINRQCNLYGKVITSGDHDAAEKDGGLFGSNDQDRQRWLVSPTINLSSTGNGSGPGSTPVPNTNYYNDMGIDDEMARTVVDYTVLMSLYNAGFVNAPTATAQFFSLGYQSYPARQPNGNIKWGEVRHDPSIFFYTTRACFETFAPRSAKAFGLIRTTNAQNRPDSLRVYLQRIGRCYTFVSADANCAPNAGDNAGTYFDNLSVALVDAGPPPPAISISIWDLINDAFPANSNDALIPSAFDTCAAQVRIGFNTAAPTLTNARPAVGGDSVVVTATGGNQRLDMVFRVLPGPGNYVTIGTKASGVRTRPDATGVLATSNDGSFFGEYMFNAGEFASQADHIGAGPGGTNWSQHIWNSARMDTLERNLFPTPAGSGVTALTPGIWRGTYHEDDDKFTSLGITKNICYMVTPTGAANSTNIKCDGLTGVGNWDVANYPASSGWDGVTVTTVEHTKIIPDGLLTPGAHVQYFFRKSTVTNTAVFEMGPDTNFVFQGSENSTDGHRWQQFGVLPDRWKEPAFADGTALSAACMLFIDWQDRRGDERFWVGVADSIGATAATRYGAHNGWHARGDQDITVAIATDPSIAVYTHGGQPGTIWDMYGVKASESATTASSFASRTTTTPVGAMTGKRNANGPTGLMLRNYYRILLILTGDITSGNLGPYPDRGDNDIDLLNDFVAGVAGTSKPRAVWLMGRGCIEGQFNGGAQAHTAWPPAFFGVNLASGDYRSFAGNTRDVVDLTPISPIETTGNRYSVVNNCFVQNDVLLTTGTFGAAAAGHYEPVAASTFVSSVYAPEDLVNGHNGVTLVEGFRIQSLGTWKETLTSQGTAEYFYNVITNLFASLACPLAAGMTISVGENPNDALVNFLALRSENPHRGGNAQITFGITRKERVELKVYDVTGRLVKTLANREFKAGEHSLFWDGTTEDGQLVARGVYFYQLRTPSFVSQKKLAVLKH